MKLINVDLSDLAKLESSLTHLERTEFPFALALAATRVAQRVKEGELDVMRQRFDRPKPFTMNSLYVRAARKTDSPPQSRVFFRDFAAKGTAAGTYLKPQVHGGEGRWKRFERALYHAGAMKSDERVVPGQGARLDNYGNIASGQINQILSGLRAFGEQGYQANATGSKRSRAKGNAKKYFAGEVDGQRGVWMRVKSAFGEGVKPVMVFTDSRPKYRVRLPMFKIAENIMAANYRQEFIRALGDAVETSRKRG